MRLVDARQACCPLDTSKECADKDCIEAEVHCSQEMGVSNIISSTKTDRVCLA